MRFFGPLILVVCVALTYAAVLQPVRAWMNTATRGDVVGAVVIGAVAVGAVSRLITAARLDEWSWRRSCDAVLGLGVAVSVSLANRLSRAALKMCAAQERLRGRM